MTPKERLIVWKMRKEKHFPGAPNEDIVQNHLT